MTFFDLQFMWFYCALAFLVLDHMMINPLRILMLHVGLPIMGGAIKGLASARSFIVKHLKNFVVEKKTFTSDGAGKRKNSVSTTSNLNVVPYTFVSYRLAKAFPALRESQAIRSMVTNFSQLHLDDPANRATVWKPYLYLIYAFIDLPLGLQDVLIHYVAAACSCFVALLVAVLNEYQPTIVPAGGCKLCFILKSLLFL